MFQSRCLIGLLCVLMAVSRASAQPSPDAVDQLFAPWAKRDTPGCALAVIHDGKIVHKRGYGMADLEHGIPIEPDTVFNIASVSKQFTVFLIMLLAQAGLLSLDDDVRRHVPDLPDFGKSITIRHLIHHTSGLREDWSMLTLSGWRSEDVITRDDVFALIRRQKTLNFDPGEDYTYCNTGYHLLAQIVQKVSGKELRVLSQEKIFEPLAMKQTVFQDHHRMVIKGKAVSYTPKAGGGFEHMLYGSGRAGPGNLHTTIEDLAKWDRNFYEPRVGNVKLLEEMQRKAKLNGGKEIDYAGGLRHGTYRGLRTVEHSGAIAGYRSVLLRFPEQHFSVIILANVSSFKPAVMARKVADLYLAKQLQPVAAAHPVSPAFVASCVGEYRSRTGLLFAFTQEKGKLYLKTETGRLPLVPAKDQEFIEPQSQTTFAFLNDGPTLKVRIQGIGLDQIGTPVARPKLDAQQLAGYVGIFRSDELDTIFTTEVRDGRLVVRHRKGEFPLHALANDEFSAPPNGLFATMRFTRNSQAAIIGFTVSTSRVRHIPFVKVTIQPPS
jgi:CubicO group peptidase (beta-lactamase class C family)